MNAWPLASQLTLHSFLLSMTISHSYLCVFYSSNDDENPLTSMKYWIYFNTNHDLSPNLNKLFSCINLTKLQPLHSVLEGSVAPTLMGAVFLETISRKGEMISCFEMLDTFNCSSFIFF